MLQALCEYLVTWGSFLSGRSPICLAWDGRGSVVATIWRARWGGSRAIEHRMAVCNGRIGNI